MALLLQGFVNGQEYRPGEHSDGGLYEEVVSIYNEHFTTPESREPYLIKVHRCIIACRTKTSIAMPYALIQKEIEIVVADINNPTKFYKYVVYNHTKCGCDKHNVTKNELHKNLVSNEVNETEFKAKLPNNPENLRNCSPSSFCSKPQPRHKLNPIPRRLTAIVPGQRFVLYYRCLPGCGATTNNTKMKTEMLSGSDKYYIWIKTDTHCWTYQKQSRVARSILESLNNLNTTYPSSLKTKLTQDSETESGVLIYIASPKVFLAAFVLSVILVSILIVDFNLCHRKKGIMYSVLSCRKDMKDNACSDCAERQKKVIEIV
ncbi:Hypothetical predicted protein [Paramuricea clavata]|nr:Hypothetical predicted protein [Paramuricea clavata]